jgi:outer membrane receptor protein involved in Fe transport
MLIRTLITATNALAFSLCINSAMAADAPATESDRDTIIVTGRKVPEATESMPVSATSLSSAWLSDLDARSFADAALLVPNLSYAYGNGESSSNLGSAISNARTVAIRGISGANTVGFYLDDMPLPVGIDPRILDLHDIAVLRGPQGTLYGESSLSGNMQWIGNAPDLKRNTLQTSLAAGATEHGGAPDASASMVMNLVVAPQQLALRLAAFSENDAGFLRRTYPANGGDPASPSISVGNQGAERSQGASLTLRLQATPQLGFDLKLLAQRSDDYGFPAAYAPLPGFTPIATLAHTQNVQPTVTDAWTLPALAMSYQGDGWKLHSSLGYFDRHSHDEEDSTEGTDQAITAETGAVLAPQPFAWIAYHDNRQLTHETRFTLEPIGAFDATAGFYYAFNRSHWNIPAIDGQGVAAAGLWPTDLLWVQNDAGTQRDMSLYGEMHYALSERVNLTLGLRHYWLNQADQMFYDGLLGGGAYQSDTSTREQGTSPKLAATYQAAEHTMTYATVSQGFRAGGAQGPVTYPGCAPDLAAIGQTSESIAHIAPDWVWNYEVGAKFEPLEGLHLDVDAFHLDWQHIQQSIFLQHCAFYVIGNAGAARVNGGEIELSGKVNERLSLRAGLGYEDGRITSTGGTGQAVGSRIYQQPRVTASMAAVYNFPIEDGLSGFVVGDYGYTGDSISANGGVNSNLIRPSYSLANLRGGVRWKTSELSLNIANLTDTRPNLGDISYIGYERYVAGTSTPMPQVATLPPRTVTLQLSQRF